MAGAGPLMKSSERGPHPVHSMLWGPRATDPFVVLTPVGFPGQESYNMGRYDEQWPSTFSIWPSSSSPSPPSSVHCSSSCPEKTTTTTVRAEGLLMQSCAKMKLWYSMAETSGMQWKLGVCIATALIIWFDYDSVQVTFRFELIQFDSIMHCISTEINATFSSFMRQYKQSHTE